MKNFIFSFLTILSFVAAPVLCFFAPSFPLGLILFVSVLFYYGYNIRLCTTVPVAQFKDRLYTPEFSSYAYPFLIKVIQNTICYTILWTCVSFFWTHAIIVVFLSLTQLTRIGIEFFRMRKLFNQLATT